MQNRNDTNNEHGHKHMMWIMLICCALPIAILLFGGSALFSGGYLPKILIGAFLAACVWMMLKGHSDAGRANAVEAETKHEHKKDGCCSS